MQKIYFLVFGPGETYGYAQVQEPSLTYIPPLDTVHLADLWKEAIEAGGMLDAEEIEALDIQEDLLHGGGWDPLYNYTFLILTDNIDRDSAEINELVADGCQHEVDQRFQEFSNSGLITAYVDKDFSVFGGNFDLFMSMLDKLTTEKLTDFYVKISSEDFVKVAREELLKRGVKDLEKLELLRKTHQRMRYK